MIKKRNETQLTSTTYLCVGEAVGLAEGEALGLDVGAFVGDEDGIDDGLTSRKR